MKLVLGWSSNSFTKVVSSCDCLGHTEHLSFLALPLKWVWPHISPSLCVDIHILPHHLDLQALFSSLKTYLVSVPGVTPVYVCC